MIAWVFNGARSTFPSGVFSTREAAEAWVKRHELTGTLTAYPMDVGVYEWAVERGYVRDEKSGERVGRFSSAHLEHYHFERGVAVTG